MLLLEVSLEPVMLMSLAPEVRKRSPPLVISDPRFVVVSEVLVQDFFLDPPLETVLSRRIEVVMLTSPFVASRRALPVLVILLPWLLMSFAATRTMFPPDSITP